MPRHEEITLTDGQWVQLTTADVTALSFQVTEGCARIAGTTGAAAPTGQGWLYGPGKGEMNIGMDRLFPGIAARRVWAQMVGGPGRIMISHA